MDEVQIQDAIDELELKAADRDTFMSVLEIKLYAMREEDNEE